MQQEFKKEIDKAEILVEALGYMQKYEGDIVVIKYGGSAMTNEIIKKSVLKDIAVLKSVGLKPIIVHGGGKDINRMLDRVQIKSEFKNGLRVTDKDLINASYFAIKNITLGYTFPKDWLTKIKMDNIRVYATANNLALFSHLNKSVLRKL